MTLSFYFIYAQLWHIDWCFKELKTIKVNRNWENHCNWHTASNHLLSGAKADFLLSLHSGKFSGLGNLLGSPLLCGDGLWSWGDFLRLEVNAYASEIVGYLFMHHTDNDTIECNRKKIEVNKEALSSNPCFWKKRDPQQKGQLRIVLPTLLSAWVSSAPQGTWL